MRDDRDEDSGCVYRLDTSDGWEVPCGRPRRPDSSFCPTHHAICHIPAGSSAERRRLDEAEALAQAVGGRLGTPAREPPDHYCAGSTVSAGFFRARNVHDMFMEGIW